MHNSPEVQQSAEALYVTRSPKMEIGGWISIKDNAEGAQIMLENERCSKSRLNRQGRDALGCVHRAWTYSWDPSMARKKTCEAEN